jgi:hypothetical protein
MLNKKNDKLSGKCPFRGLKSCDNECILFREGVRYTEDGKNTFPFSDCAINIIADNIEAMHNRSFMLQKEVGETKNVMALKILSEIQACSTEDVAREAVRIIKTDQQNKLLSE